MLKELSTSPARSQVGQDAAGQFQVAAHVSGQRVEHLAVLPGGLHVGLAQQRGQAVNVPAAIA